MHYSASINSHKNLKHPDVDTWRGWYSSAPKDLLSSPVQWLRGHTRFLHKLKCTTLTS